eukprot:m.30754 g.30754  ORF g.30754 m.30754 type:complete len:71 (+) comp6835_c0_seq1:1954-2166(+)
MLEQDPNGLLHLGGLVSVAALQKQGSAMKGSAAVLTDGIHFRRVSQGKQLCGRHTVRQNGATSDSDSHEN